MPWLSTLIGLVIVGAGTCIYVFISRQARVQEFLGSEKTFEISYQFLLVTVVGGAVALLYKQLDKRRENRRALREMHSELLTAYNRAKAVRRRLRARLGTVAAIKPAAKIAAGDYEEQMELLSESQLTFEVYVKRARGPLWFWASRRLVKQLGLVEKYLNTIVKEYERELVTFEGDPPTKDISQLKSLCEFVGPYNEAHDFQRNFKYPFRDALVELDRVILR